MAKRKSTLNRETTAKPRGKPFTGRDDPRTNLKGAPKRGQSWKEIYSEVGNMTPKEAAEYCRAVAGKLAAIGDQVTLKEAVVLRVYAALMFDPDARLLNAVMDRDEGKVKQEIEINDWRTEARQQGYDPDKLFTDMVAAARARMDGESSSGSVAGGAIDTNASSTNQDTA